MNGEDVPTRRLFLRRRTPRPNRALPPEDPLVGYCFFSGSESGKKMVFACRVQPPRDVWVIQYPASLTLSDLGKTLDKK